MQQHATYDNDANVDDFPPIEIPPDVRATPEEIARRQAPAKEARRIRKQLGPLGFSAVDLIREARDEPVLNERD